MATLYDSEGRPYEEGGEPGLPFDITEGGKYGWRNGRYYWRDAYGNPLSYSPEEMASFDGRVRTALPEDSWFGKIGEATVGNGPLLVGLGMSAVGGMGLADAFGAASSGGGAFTGSGGGSGGTGMDWWDAFDNWYGTDVPLLQGTEAFGMPNPVDAAYGAIGGAPSSVGGSLMPPAVPASPSELSNWGLVETAPGRWELPPISAGGASILSNFGSSAINGLMNGKMLGAGLGALAGALGGAKQAGTTTTIQDLPDWLKPYAITGLSGAAEAYGSTPPGVAPVTAAGNQYMMDVIGGDYLDSNPYLDAMYDRAAGKVKAGVNGMFSKSGRYGSGAHQGVMGETLGNLATDIYGGNYARERGFQQSAAGGAPAYGNSIISQPFLRSQNLLSGVNSIKAGSTTAPYFDNKIGNILSGALGGRALAS